MRFPTEWTRTCYFTEYGLFSRVDFLPKKVVLKMRWVLLGIVFITTLYSPLVHNVVNFPISNGNFHNLEDHNLEQVVKKCYGPVVLVFIA